VTLWQTWRQAFRAGPKRARIYEGARLEEIARVETLAEAWRRVRANKGGPGGDGVTIDDLATGIELSLEDLSKKLLAESYRPKKLRRAFIRKVSGGKRPLSIPAVIDRVAQTAAMLVLEPEMDARMSETSLAYRVGRGPPLAIAAVQSAFAEGLVWAVDADIEGYLDPVSYCPLVDEAHANSSA
jgi:retron-type reverse transcriptase